MSESINPESREKISIFGSGGGEETAKRLSKLIGVDVPLLAKIPFDPILREGGDEGNPIALTDKKFTTIFYKKVNIKVMLKLRKKIGN